MDVNEQPLVSVQMITYNHALYIAEAIEGVMAQITNFPFELVISDDCSTDGTRDICKRYAEQYPDKIKLLLPEKNLGMSDNAGYCFSNCIGKYIAVCEGDDYWTEPNKLQIQVDFLESHPEYAFCVHRFHRYDQDSGNWQEDYAAAYYIDGENLEITKRIFFRTWITHPLTVVYRRSMHDPQLSKIYKNFRDIHFYYYMLKRGRGISLNRVMGVYRLHSGGVSGKVNVVKNLKIHRSIYFDLWKHNPTDLRLLKLVAIKNLVLLKLGITS